jgi:hypothetical protein
MPLGIVSDEDFDKELAGTGISHQEIKHGRGAKQAIPFPIRALAASEAIAGGDPQEIAEALDISLSSISAYKHDATSTASYNQPNSELKQANDDVRKHIIGTARARLLEALAEITPAKLKDAKLRDVASVAKDMSTIISNTEPQSVAPQVGAQFVFHVPRQRKESDFDVIDVTN